MPTMNWTRCASTIQIKEDGYIDLEQFKVGQVIEHTEGDQAWMIIKVREQWLKLLPLFDCYVGDPRTHERHDRFSVDIAFEEGYWRIRRQ